jgi:pyruvate dehydrogenase complex dehydrogenase (E1) component
MIQQMVEGSITARRQLSACLIIYTCLPFGLRLMRDILYISSYTTCQIGTLLGHFTLQDEGTTHQQYSTISQMTQILCTNSSSGIP